MKPVAVPTRLLAGLSLALGLLLPAEAAPQDGAGNDAVEETEEATLRFESSVEVEGELPAGPPSSSLATRIPTPVADLPVSLAVVPRPLLDEQGTRVLADALENVSGVNVGTGFGVFDFFVIRGFDSLSSGLVLTDGVPEPEATFYPMYNVAQVDVLKGPASFLLGGNPLAGAVQLGRKQPRPTRFADVVLGYGRYGSFEASLDANAATGDGRLAGRLNATVQGTDGYRDLPEGSIWAVNPNLAWRPDDRTRIGLDFELVRSEWPPDTGIPFVGESGSELAPVPRTRSYQSPFDASVQDAWRFRLEAERRLSSSLTLRNRLYYTELTWDSDGTLLNGAFPGPDGRSYVARTLVLLDDRQRLLGDQLELAASFRTGSVAHELLGGVELRSLKDRFTQDVALLPPLDLLEPVETAQPPFFTLPPFAQKGDARAITVAPYVVDRARFSSKLSAFAGARLDVLDYDDPANATSRDDTSVNPLLGLVYSPLGNLALHASWATASAPPSTQVVGPREPEESRQLEIGGKLTFLGGKGFATASVYHLERDGIAIPDSTGITRQTGDQRSRGFELDVSAEPVRGWVTYAAYAYTDAELTRFSEIVPLLPPDFVVVDRSGNRPAFAPRHLFSLWTSKRLDVGLGLALGLRSVGEQYVSEDNRYTIEAYTTLDAAVSYEIGRVRLRAHLRNLTGTEYATRGFGSASAIPARPFEASLRAEVGFGRR
jgi:iron complex outermembrane receptor protein